ncbi:MAG: SRPBCC domain-containing protein [Candidatus Accumulibacter sp.]|nr:SRPBCC domain-containing protein [Accumulibacter sp.]
MTHEVNSPVSLELLLTRLIDAPREKLFRVWTDPALIIPCFTPAPWNTLRAEVDLQPGGSSLIVMQNPEGQEFPSPGVYLEGRW